MNPIHSSRRAWNRHLTSGLLVLAWSFAAFSSSLRLLAAEAPAEPIAGKKVDALDAEPAKWMKFTDNKKGGGKLEVGVGTYKNDAGVTVQLVGAVHVGDKKYYSDLDKQFEGYDALLYEMVKPANAGAPAKGKKAGGGMITFFQRFLKDTLELEFQLDGIDYTKKNFVHADLDAETFEKMQDERGESLLGLMLQQMLRELAKGAEGKGAAGADMNLMDLIDALNSPDRAKHLKMIMGKAFGESEGEMGFQNTVLVTERNKKALSVLKESIRGGKKNIGVFYGAAHMPDMESRLTLMGFKRTAMEYRVAWDMTDAPAGNAPKKDGKKE